MTFRNYCSSLDKNMHLSCGCGEWEKEKGKRNRMELEDLKSASYVYSLCITLVLGIIPKALALDIFSSDIIT